MQFRNKSKCILIRLYRLPYEKISECEALTGHVKLKSWAAINFWNGFFQRVSFPSGISGLVNGKCSEFKCVDIVKSPLMALTRSSSVQKGIDVGTATNTFSLGRPSDIDSAWASTRWLFCLYSVRNHYRGVILNFHPIVQKAMVRPQVDCLMKSKVVWGEVFCRKFHRDEKVCCHFTDVWSSFQSMIYGVGANGCKTSMIHLARREGLTFVRLTTREKTLLAKLHSEQWKSTLRSSRLPTPPIRINELFTVGNICSTIW